MRFKTFEKPLKLLTSSGCNGITYNIREDLNFEYRKVRTGKYAGKASWTSEAEWPEGIQVVSECLILHKNPHPESACSSSGSQRKRLLTKKKKTKIAPKKKEPRSQSQNLSQTEPEFEALMMMTKRKHRC